MSKKTKPTSRRKTEAKHDPSEPKWIENKNHGNAVVVIDGVQVRAYEVDGVFWGGGGGMLDRQLQATDLSAAKTEALTRVEFHLRALADNVRSFRDCQ